MEPMALLLLILLVLVPGALAIWGNLFSHSAQDTVGIKIMASATMLLMLSSFIGVSVFI